MNDIRYEDHTDSVPQKLRLLEALYAAGKLDIARSLAVSLEDTLDFERLAKSSLPEAAIAAEQFVALDALPKPWQAWAAGWKFAKSVTLFETVGIARSREPVELAVAFRADQVDDLGREVRVARVNPQSRALEEVACQVNRERRRAGELHCELVFQADVAAHQQASYFIFYGNPLAERTDYASDLRIAGEGYGLDIDNQYFSARLSRQVGQLERLTSKRQHGLELYAGGKGHGEPPGIDWAHDYVDAGGFQKLRMRNAPECRSFEVDRGPLCARIRRWGFPYSPIHPLFTPARIHIDQTYVFHAGLPYFFKEGRFDVVQDVRIEAMRDDEWVFSGYSFTDTLWIDAAGKLHEGDVPKEHADKLWGVGFRNRTSHDAFVALWLEHTAEGAPGPAHGGVPTLHYDGHGQLWSRYPAAQTQLKAGASIRQRNAYLFAPLKGDDAIDVEQLRHQLLHPLEAHAADPPSGPAATTGGGLARRGETKQTAPLKPAIWEALRLVRDEQLYTATASIVDLGYVYDVRDRNGVVSVLVTMPHRGRPVYDFLVSAGGGRVEPGIRERVLKVPGVREVVVDFTWEPPWSEARLSDAGRRAMDLAT